MMHPKRCGNGCQRFRPTNQHFPAGACEAGGIVLNLTPQVRQWIDLRGCGSFAPPVSTLIDCDTIQAANRLKAMVKEMQNTPFADEVKS